MKSNDLIDITKKMQEIICYIEENNEKIIKKIDEICCIIEMKIMRR